MSKKKSKQISEIETTEISLQYFQNWKLLSEAREEKEFDEIRKILNNIWSQMNEKDKRCFKNLTKFI
jgi:hypothetical protein